MSTALRLDARQRLEVLAAAVLDYLDDAFSESELDDDSNPPHTELYNLAGAMADAAVLPPVDAHSSALRLHADHERHADDLAANTLEYRGDTGRLGIARQRIAADLERVLGGADA